MLPAETPAPFVPEGTLFFNRYRYLRELGRGGMGLVLLAHDEVLEIQVALKLVPSSVVRDAEGLQDLKREVLRGMALSHPNIVRVHSFEQDAEQGAIVMEYVAGATLAEAKAQQAYGCFEPAALLTWLEQLCSVLDHAHQQVKIAHRDLKPRNLLLTPEGKIKVADFGISCSLAETMHRVTGHADASGTPPYMSPQQAMGEPASHLDDIYSLGATLYDLLTGKPPFYRGNITLQTLQSLAPSLTVRRQELGKPPATIPVAWERLVAACLAKDPAARPRNGREILAFLGAPLGGGNTERAAVASLRPLRSPLETTGLSSPPPAATAAIASGRQSQPLTRTRRSPPPRARRAFARSPLSWPFFASALLAGALLAGLLHPFRRPAPMAVSATPLPVAATPPAVKFEPLTHSNLQPSRSLSEPTPDAKRTTTRRTH